VLLLLQEQRVSGGYGPVGISKFASQVAKTLLAVAFLGSVALVAPTVALAATVTIPVTIDRSTCTATTGFGDFSVAPGSSIALRVTGLNAGTCYIVLRAQSGTLTGWQLPGGVDLGWTSTVSSTVSTGTYVTTYTVGSVSASFFTSPTVGASTGSAITDLTVVTSPAVVDLGQIDLDLGSCTVTDAGTLNAAPGTTIKFFLNRIGTGTCHLVLRAENGKLDGWSYNGLDVGFFNKISVDQTGTGGTGIVQIFNAGTAAANIFVATSGDATSGSQILRFTPHIAAEVSDTGQTPPPWIQSYGRKSADEECAPGWSPSWAQWFVDASGSGWVCNRTLFYDNGVWQTSPDLGR